LLERREPHVLVEPRSAERTVLPRPHLQLAAVDRLLHVYTCIGEPPEMLVAPLGIHEMKRLVAALEAICDERAKHSVLLVGAVKNPQI
jgi:hypothetical protein